VVRYGPQLPYGIQMGGNKMTDPKQTVYKNEIWKFKIAAGFVIPTFTFLLGITIAIFSGQWLFFYVLVLAGILIFFMISIYPEYIQKPTTIVIQSDGFILIYRYKKEIFYQLSDIQWLNLWPGSQNALRYSAVKIMNNSKPPQVIPYEAGLDLKQAYIDKFGIKPMNYDEYLNQTHDFKWYSLPPSE
jgi:hypothetical protein